MPQDSLSVEPTQLNCKCNTKNTKSPLQVLFDLISAFLSCFKYTIGKILVFALGEHSVFVCLL